MFFASLQVFLANRCSVNSYNFGGPMGGGEPRVFPLCHLTTPLIKTLTSVLTGQFGCSVEKSLKKRNGINRAGRAFTVIRERKSLGSGQGCSIHCRKLEWIWFWMHFEGRFDRGLSWNWGRRKKKLSSMIFSFQTWAEWDWTQVFCTSFFV